MSQPSSKPLILLSNDDGYLSPNLATLVAAIENHLDVEWVVVAPERERSAISHSITLHKPLRVIEHREGWFSVSGSPVDCVYVGTLKLLPRPPDLVVSGVNRGYNLGSDVIYSGTVAAATEGALRGVPAIAFSHAARAPLGAESRAARFATSLIERVLERGLPPQTMLNVNFPAEVRGYRWTRLGVRAYEDLVEERHDPRGRRYYWIGGTVADGEHAEGTDCHAIEQHLISVTPLTTNRSDHGLLQDPWPIGGAGGEE